MKTWRDMIGQDWRVAMDPEGAEATVLRLPQGNRINRGMVGPLATIPAGEMETNDDGDPVAVMEDEDGRNLLAILALPKVAELLAFIEDAQAKLNPVCLDVQTENGRFHAALRDRAARIVNMVDRRERTMCEGTFVVE